MLTAGQPYDDFVYPVGIEGVGADRGEAAEAAEGPKGHGGGHGGGHGATAAATAVAADARSAPTGRDCAQPSWRRTSAATTPPSARPLTWGWTTPITLPIAFMPSPAAPVCSTAAVTSATISSSESCSGR